MHGLQRRAPVVPRGGGYGPRQKRWKRRFGKFTVQLNNGATEIVDVLKAGARTTLVFTTWAGSEHIAVVDADFSIEESDETNNTVETFIAVPTLVPPPTCTPSG